MQVNSVLNKNLTDKDRELGDRVLRICLRARSYLAKLPYGSRLIYDCHSIARAISLVVPELKVVSGVYLGIKWTTEGEKSTYALRGCRHSWLVTPDGAILDPYPVGFLTLDVVLIPATAGNYTAFGQGLYRVQEVVLSEIPIRKIWKKTRALHKLVQKSEAHYKNKKEV